MKSNITRHIPKSDKYYVRPTAKHLPYGYMGKNGYNSDEELVGICNPKKIRQQAKKQINDELNNY